MGNIDICEGRYMESEERCADVLNVGCFDGERVISPKQIQEYNPVINLVVKDGQNSKGRRTMQPRRDVLKVVTYNTNFFIVGIENQSDIHYVMPVRAMLYDAGQYEKQWSKIRKEHRDKGDLEGAEKLSGFSKEDTLKAVTTVVVYFGTRPWDGARDIHSLIDWTEVPEKFKDLIPNYSIHLLELNKYENLDDFQSDLKAVARFIQNSEDDKKLEDMLKEHGEEFADLPEETYDLLGVLGNMTQLKAIKNKCKKEDGGYDMCKGMDDWLKRKEEEGINKGLTQGAHNKLIEQVNKKLLRGKGLEEIADDLEESVETICTLIDEIKGRKAV